MKTGKTDSGASCATIFSKYHSQTLTQCSVCLFAVTQELPCVLLPAGGRVRGGAEGIQTPPAWRILLPQTGASVTVVLHVSFFTYYFTWLFPSAKTNKIDPVFWSREDQSTFLTLACKKPHCTTNHSKHYSKIIATCQDHSTIRGTPELCYFQTFNIFFIFF